MSQLTPMMEQYMRVKDEHPYCLVFFRLGDFYEMFFDDALVASRELELTLTARDCGLAERAPMCGVPHHAADGYIARLIEKGYKVAICEQLEDARAVKGLVKRGVVRVVTPGTVLDERLLDEGRNNYISAVCEETGRIGIATADVSTGEFYAYSVDKSEIRDELARINPAEIVAPDKWGMEDLLTGDRPEYTFEASGARMVLSEHFGVCNLADLGIGGDDAAVRAAGGLLFYLRDTQKNALSHLTALKHYKRGEHLAIDAASRRNLELNLSLRERKKVGSLLWVLDKTKTAMGARMLNRWLMEPLSDARQINVRLDAVEELRHGAYSRDALRAALGEVFDIERLIGRIVYKTAAPKDLLALRRSLAAAPHIKGLLESFNSSYLTYFYTEMDVCPDICDLLSRAVADEVGANLGTGGYIRQGYSPELDALRHDKDNGAGLILEMEAAEKAKTGIKNLKITFNKVFGYTIEVTKSNLHMVPDSFNRIQTLANSERYSTPALKALEGRILAADEGIAALELRLWQDITAQISAQLGRIQALASALAVIDVLQSLAEVAERNNYVRPTLNTRGRVDISDGRHPVVERMIDAPFIPNDTYMDEKTARLLTITGPNMAGKSTFMRQVALIVIMAQMGGFVPARMADIGLCDKLFTRIGASDDLSSGQSTFMVEMAELSNILNNATQKSLLILDEIGRGTSTYDGMAIAWATLEHIERLGALTLFATHYHEMTELEGKVAGVVNYHAQVKESGENILFMHKIIKGGADRSYGIHVARLAGLPESLISRATEIMNALTAKDLAPEDPEDPEYPADATKSDVVHYGTARRKALPGNRITLENVQQLTLRDVFKEL